MLILRIVLMSYALLTLSFNVISQNSDKNISPDIFEIIAQVNNVYGVNDELVNGIVYPIPDSKIKGNPFLLDAWAPTALYINNNTFHNFYVNYDLIIDNIVLKIELANGIERLIDLNKFQIDSFRLANGFFINSLVLNKDKPSPTFLERIYKGDYSLYMKYEKVFIRKYNNTSPFGKYSSVRKDIYLFYNNELYNVTRKSTFLSHFEKSKQSDIKKFMKRNHIRYRKALKSDLMELMKYCDILTQ